MKILRNQISAGVILLLMYCSCKKVNYYPDKLLPFTGSVMLAHRGGGNDTLRENSLEACIHALSITDGIEVDVQISKNKTVWLSHSPIVEACGKSFKCFAETTDKEIESIFLCNGTKIGYTRLEDVLDYMHRHNIKKHISIDLKGWSPCSGHSLDIEAMMRLEVEEVIKIGDKYGLTSCMLFEVEIPTVLRWAKSKSKLVSAYITSFGDYEKGMLLALKHKLDGISYKSHFKDELDKNKIDLLHKKGLKLMAWNIPDNTYMKYLQSIGVDLLQIDL